MLILTSVCTLFMEIFICFDFYSSLSSRKIRTVSTFLIISLLYFLQGLSAIALNNIAVNIIFSLVVNLLPAIICYHLEFKKAMFCALFLTVVMSITEFISISLFSLINNVSVGSNDYMMTTLIDDELYFVFAVFSKLLYFVTEKIFSRKFSANRQQPIFLYIFPIFALLDLYVFYIILSQNKTDTLLKVLIALAASFLVASVFLGYMFFVKHSQKVIKNNKIQTEEEKAVLESSYYELLDKQNLEMRRLIHDEKNHLSAIKSIAQNAEVDKYIDGLYEEIGRYSITGNTQNKVLDLIINKYKQICAENKIEFDTVIKTANLSFLSDADLIAIVRNILDNAIEAALKSSEKKVEFGLNKKNGFDVLVCTNSSDHSPVLQGENFVTTKETSGFHGVGMSIIKKITAKYSGSFEWSYDDLKNEFTIYIVFKNKG